MDVADVLVMWREEIIDDAVVALHQARLPHYEAEGDAVARRQLEHLFALVVESLSSRNLTPVSRYAQEVAEERFDAGFHIGEVQAAFNVLEETIWAVVVPKLPPEDLVEATGLIGTVLGAGKDTLACTWVSLASSQHVPSLDLGQLFEGVSS